MLGATERVAIERLWSATQSAQHIRQRAQQCTSARKARLTVSPVCAHCALDRACYSARCCALFWSLFMDTVHNTVHDNIFSKKKPWDLGRHNFRGLEGCYDLLPYISNG